MAAEAEKFAALLRMLKERSGKSYGQLASRLHVSNSTLHRYCHGTTVPPSFAPAERLARLCGATPGELVALHRLWLRADAARDQKAPATVPASEEPAADLTTGDLLTRDLPLTGPKTAATGGTPGAGTVAAARAPGAGASEAAAAAAPWWRRPVTVIAVAVAAVTVSVTAVALPKALSGAAPSGSARSGPLSPGPSPFRSAPPGPTPSGGSTPSGASPSGTRTRAAGGQSSATPATGTPAVSPIQVSVLDDNWDDPCGRWYLSGRAPGTVPAPPDPGGVAAWAARLGAVPAGHRRLELTVQTTRDEPVVLHALYVRVHSVGAAPHWAAFNMGTGCGGGITPASYAIDLDAAAPTARPTPGTQGDSTVPAVAFPLQVSRDDPQVLDIDASTATRDVTWSLELLWSQGSAQGTLVVDDHGSPFRTAGTAGAPRYVYDLGGTNTWRPDHDPEDTEWLS